MPSRTQTQPSDYLVFSAFPCDVAIAARDVLRISTRAESQIRTLVDLGETLGIHPMRPGADAESDQRVLLSTLLPEESGLLVPHAVSLLSAEADEVLPLPSWLTGRAFTGMLTKDGVAHALLIDCRRISP
jgi:hypothetical protein